LNVRQMANVFDELPGLTKSQKEVLSSAIRHLRKDDYTLVFGQPKDLDLWEQTYNADRYIPGSNESYGKIDPVSRVILISNPSQETLIHELVHAATYYKV